MQVREELRRARMEGSRQRARELQWELKAAQLTAAGLQEQVCMQAFSVFVTTIRICLRSSC